jgi:hypothetical protein
MRDAMGGETSRLCPTDRSTTRRYPPSCAPPWDPTLHQTPHGTPLRSLHHATLPTELCALTLTLTP